MGAKVLLYDGNPFYPDPGVLWRTAQDERITVFGTSAGYIAALMNEEIRPGKEYDLSALKAVLSTGSPLSEEGFEFIYREVKADLQLASISGGSDINGCFALGNPMGPVYSGELQCRGLGMKVEAFDENGKPVVNRQGELVCTAPAPSMPIYFWDDPGDKKYRAAYFEVYPNVWRHGDYILITERGGVIMYGRSDATLNPGGVRIGTAEIYRQVDTIDGIVDSIVVGQNWKNDVRVILFVKMEPGRELTDELKEQIRKTIRINASPRHVPAKIIAVPDIPYTLTMKKVELSVKKVIEGQAVLNKDALKNPESLDLLCGDQGTAGRLSQKGRSLLRPPSFEKNLKVVPFGDQLIAHGCPTIGADVVVFIAVGEHQQKPLADRNGTSALSAEKLCGVKIFVLFSSHGVNHPFPEFFLRLPTRSQPRYHLAPGNRPAGKGILPNRPSGRWGRKSV